MGTTTQSLQSELGDVSNILLLTPSLSSQDDKACMELLQVTDIAQEDVLSITFTQSATDRLKIWEQHVGTHPAKTAIVSVGEMTRSATGQTTGTVPISETIIIDTVTNPGDLTGLGISISQRLSEWAEDENQMVICFHSLTPLLQYAELQRVFRFLHVLTGRMHQADAVAHFHLDPSAHDQQTISTLLQLFDTVVEIQDTEDEEVSVSIQ